MTLVKIRWTGADYRLYLFAYNTCLELVFQKNLSKINIFFILIYASRNCIFTSQQRNKRQLSTSAINSTACMQDSHIDALNKRNHARRPITSIKSRDWKLEPGLITRALTPGANSHNNDKLKSHTKVNVSVVLKATLKRIKIYLLKFQMSKF